MDVLRQRSETKLQKSKEGQKVLYEKTIWILNEGGIAYDEFPTIYLQRSLEDLQIQFANQAAFGGTFNPLHMPISKIMKFGCKFFSFFVNHLGTLAQV